MTNNQKANELYCQGLLQEKDSILESASTLKAVSLYEQAAELGNSDAMYRLGIYYKNIGSGEKAVEYFRRAAELEHGKAAYVLGECYRNGEGVEQDYALAFECYQKAQADNLGSYQLAYCYEYGLGTEKNIKRAAMYYDDYLEMDERPDLALGMLYESDVESEGNYEAAAKLGMGRCLLQMDDDEAFLYGRAQDYLGEAWDMDEYEAEYYLGLMRLYGLKRKPDPEEGLEYLQEAAKYGVAAACEFLKQKTEQDELLRAAVKAGRADAEQRRQEAILRLSILEQKGLGKNAKERFQTDGLPGISFDDRYGVMSFTPDNVNDYEELRDIIVDFEKRNVTVYYLQYSLTFMGTMVSLFFVSDNPADWENDRKDLLKESPIVAVANLSEDYMELGTIRFLIERHGMERQG